MQLLWILMQICKNMQKKLTAEYTCYETSRYLIRIIIRQM